MLYKSLVRFNLKLTLKKLALSFYFLATGERNLAKGWKLRLNCNCFADFGDKDLSSQSYGFSSSHVWMWELDYKERWAP